MIFFSKCNPLLEDKVNLYFKKIEEINIKKYHGQISIILLGSLSRGEGSWYKRENDIILLSDIEFLTIIPKGFTEKKELEEELHSVAKDIFGSNTSFFHIDSTFITLMQLKRLEKKLLTFDANLYGTTVVGNDYINMIPKVTIQNINYHDIFDILIHRSFSILYYGIPLKKQNHIEEYRYSLAKNSLDLLTVFLIEKRILVSGFTNKCEELEKIDFDQRIKDYFNYCLKIKLREDAFGIEFKIEEMENIFIYLLEYLVKNFKYPIHNSLVNFKTNIRRKLGMTKRMIKSKVKPMTRKKYLKHLIFLIKENKSITKNDLEINYVLNGYPDVNEIRNRDLSAF